MLGSSVALILSLDRPIASQWQCDGGPLVLCQVLHWMTHKITRMALRRHFLLVTRYSLLVRNLLVTQWKITRFSLYNILVIIQKLTRYHWKATRYHPKITRYHLKTYSLSFKNLLVIIQNLLVIIQNLLVMTENLKIYWLRHENLNVG